MPSVGQLTDINSAYQSLYDTIHGHLKSTYTDLVSKVNSQNTLLDRQIQETNTEQSTAFTEGEYENQSTNLVKNILKYTTYLFFIVAVMFLFVLYSKYPTIPWYIKILILLTIGLYPYWILYLENILYKIFSYIYSFIMLKVVKNVYITTDKLQP